LASTTIELFDVIKKLSQGGVEPTIIDVMKKYHSETGNFISQRTVRSYLDDLTEIGLLEKATHPQDKRRNVYYPVEEKLRIEANSIFTAISKRFFEKDLENWLRKILQQRECKITICLQNGEKYELIHEDDEKIKIVSNKLYNSLLMQQYLSGQYMGVFSENKPEVAAKNENAEIHNFSETRILGEAPEGFTCELCGKPNAEVVAEFKGRKICVHERCLKDAG
jgi:DNA-binding MarR family transcriptional regulator